MNLQEIEAQLSALKPMSIQEIEAQIADVQIQIDNAKSSAESIPLLERKKGYLYALKDEHIHAKRREELLRARNSILSESKVIEMASKKKVESE